MPTHPSPSERDTDGHDPRECAECLLSDENAEGPDRLLGETPLFAGVVGAVLLLVLLGLSALAVVFDERWLR